MIRSSIRTSLLAAALALFCAADLTPANAAPLPLAQQTATEDSNSNRSTYRSRRGYGKLIGACVGGVILAGGWVIKKIKGE